MLFEGAEGTWITLSGVNYKEMSYFRSTGPTYVNFWGASHHFLSFRPKISTQTHTYGHMTPTQPQKTRLSTGTVECNTNRQ